jgi:endonuclease G
VRALAISLIFAGACATEPDGSHESATAAEVMGGSNAPDGKWPDIAAVNFAGQQGCTGTLIAPTVVLTAGHCNDAELDSVLVGTASLNRAADGETIAVAQRIEYESSPGAGDSYETMDLTVLVLARPSVFAPRALATAWARFDIVNGAQVTIAGYGGINAESTQYVFELQEAITTITDAECTEKPGCNASVAPAGELGAGGMGVDTCPGDSGGPLYLMTAYGNFLAGATSRAYDDATTQCKDGGVYVPEHERQATARAPETEDAWR